jgi:3-methyladenine DNA glycosylase AlkD
MTALKFLPNNAIETTSFIKDEEGKIEQTVKVYNPLVTQNWTIRYERNELFIVIKKTNADGKISKVVKYAFDSLGHDMYAFTTESGNRFWFEWFI